MRRTRWSSFARVCSKYHGVQLPLTAVAATTATLPRPNAKAKTPAARSSTIEERNTRLAWLISRNNSSWTSNGSVIARPNPTRARSGVTRTRAARVTWKSTTRAVPTK